MSTLGYYNVQKERLGSRIGPYDVGYGLHAGHGSGVQNLAIKKLIREGFSIVNHLIVNGSCGSSSSMFRSPKLNILLKNNRQKDK